MSSARSPSARHRLIVAREYGVPAVVATGDATTRLVDGEVVLVDGSQGYVELLS
jgi:phosphoenolpyruvate-protein kinase (PTS system EI component)